MTRSLLIRIALSSASLANIANYSAYAMEQDRLLEKSTALPTEDNNEESFVDGEKKFSSLIDHTVVDGKCIPLADRVLTAEELKQAYTCVDKEDNAGLEEVIKVSLHSEGCFPIGLLPIFHHILEKPLTNNTIPMITSLIKNNVLNELQDRSLVTQTYARKLQKYFQKYSLCALQIYNETHLDSLSFSAIIANVNDSRDKEYDPKPFSLFTEEISGDRDLQQLQSSMYDFTCFAPLEFLLLLKKFRLANILLDHPQVRESVYIDFSIPYKLSRKTPFGLAIDHRERYKTGCQDAKEIDVLLEKLISHQAMIQKFKVDQRYSI